MKACRFYHCWCCSCIYIFPLYLSQLTLPHLLSPRTHLCPLTHLGSHAHLHMSLPLASQLHRPESSMVLGPRSLSQIAFSSLPFPPHPSPPLPHACSLPFTLPNTPTFIPAHKQAPTCLPLHSSPFTHTFASAHTFPGLNMLEFQYMHTLSLTHRHVL